MSRGEGNWGGSWLWKQGQRDLAEMTVTLLDETPLTSDQKIVKGKGGHRLTATLFDSWQIRFWIMSHGPDIVVTRPAALRKEIVARIDEVRTAYGRGAGE